MAKGKRNGGQDQGRETELSPGVVHPQSDDSLSADQESQATAPTVNDDFPSVISEPAVRPEESLAPTPSLGWTPPGTKGLGIAGTARFPQRQSKPTPQPGPARKVVKVSLAEAAAAGRQPAPAVARPWATAPAPVAPSSDRPVVKVSMAQAAAAGHQAPRVLSPLPQAVARPTPAAEAPPRPAPHVPKTAPAAALQAPARPQPHAPRTSPAAAPQAPARPQPHAPRTSPHAAPVRTMRAPAPVVAEPVPVREVAPAEPLSLPDPDARYLAVPGLSSPACVARIEKAVRAVPGVTEVEANLAAGVVAVAPASVDAAAVAEALRSAGHPPLDEAPNAATARIAARKAGILAAAATAAGLLSWFLRDRVFAAAVACSVLALAAAAPAALSALRHLVRGRLAAELLPILAGVTLVVAAVAAGPGFPVELAAAPLAMHLAVLALSSAARAQALATLEALRGVLPQDGAGLKVGQRLEVEAGKVVPVDGRLLGAAILDESRLGGDDEVERFSGEEIAAGTVATHGAALEVTAPASRSRVRRGLAVAERALTTHPVGTPSQLGARILVPLALALAVAAGVLGGPLAAGAVLAGATPLALGLAASLSSAAALTRAASRGVAVRSSEALDRAARAQVVILDKTTTLTRGDTAVLEFLAKPGRDPLEILPLVAAAESGVDHPISRALSLHARELHLQVPAASDRRFEAGLGVEATVAGQRVLVGSQRFVTSRGADVGLLGQTVDDLSRRGRSPLVVVLDGEAVAVLGLGETPRESARRAMGSLELLDVKVRILSGDAGPAVQWLAEAMGLDKKAARGDVTADGKRALVQELRAMGPCVMAGAAPVDAEALAAADLAVAASSHPEVEARAGALLIRHDPEGLVELLRAARASRRARLVATTAGLVGNGAALGLSVSGLIGPMGAVAIAFATSVVAIASAASPWIRVR